MSLLEPVLTPWEHLRRQTHRDIDLTCDTWPVALLDAQSRGYPTAVMQPRTNGESELTSVESAALYPDYATGWIAQLGDILHTFGLRHPVSPEQVRRPWHQALETLMLDWPPHTMHTIDRLHELANGARAHWPTRPARGTTVNGVTVGERTNTVEICVLCEIPVTGTESDPIKRVNNEPFHLNCWYTKQLTPIRAKSQRTCSIDGCDRPHHARDLCQPHYSRWLSTGVLGGSVGLA